MISLGRSLSACQGRPHFHVASIIVELDPEETWKNSNKVEDLLKIALTVCDKKILIGAVYLPSLKESNWSIGEMPHQSPVFSHRSGSSLHN